MSPLCPRWHLARASVISFITLCYRFLSNFDLPINFAYKLWAHEGCGNLTCFPSWHLPDYLHIQGGLKCWPNGNQEIIVLIFKAGYSLHFSTQDSGGTQCRNLALSCWWPKESSYWEKKYNTIPPCILVKSHSCKLPKQKKAFNQMESKCQRRIHVSYIFIT